MEITAEMVKILREKTQAGILDCKNALNQTDGDIEKAAELLRKKGIVGALKKATRAASEGRIASYIHFGDKLGVLLEINCETDFVAKNEQFVSLAKEICMQIAAANPTYVSRDHVPEDVLDKEKEILRAQIQDSRKPPEIIEKIIEGRLTKFYKENCLLEQEYIKDPKKTIEELVKETIATTGENIVIRRFTRYQVGEEL